MRKTLFMLIKKSPVSATQPLCHLKMLLKVFCAMLVRHVGPCWCAMLRHVGAPCCAMLVRHVAPC
ncbi:MAG: hypothetical protein ISQ23_08795 [Alphaproteobacteria bacterium]|nr:hypothetical protein [Alphaproteobacteria bacterium]